MFPAHAALETTAHTSGFARCMRAKPLAALLLPVLMVAALGWLDRATGWELSLFMFYGLPVACAVWWSGLAAGVFVSGLCGAVWYAANFYSNPYETELGFIWAMLNRVFYFGVVVFATNSVRRRQDDDAARIRMLEEHRQLERDIVRVSEHEQQRIGQDLHDGLCQQLAAIGCATRVLADELQSRQMPEAKDAVMIEESIQHAVMEARNLARGIFPVHVDRDGLSAALSDLARMTGKLTGVNIEVHEDTETHLDSPETAMHLYRIAQEAVANAVRHSGATRVIITLHADDRSLEMTIADNGTGLPPASQQQEAGMGLRTMSYRAQTMGAQLNIRPRQEGGTTVQCRLATNNAPTS